MHIGSIKLTKSSRKSGPIFTPLLIKDADSGRDVWKRLAKLRNDPGVTDLRHQLARIEAITSSRDVVRLKKLRKSIEKIGVNILRSHGLEDRVIKLTPSSVLATIGVTGDDLEVSLPIPRRLYKQYFIGRNYRAFVRDVYDEIATFSTFGQVKDNLDRFARVKDNPGVDTAGWYAKSNEMPPSMYYRHFRKATPPTK